MFLSYSDKTRLDCFISFFKLCVVPTSQAKSGKFERAIPVATACGRAQIVSVISSHPAFAFRYLLDLILTSVSRLDTQTNFSTKAPRGPDLESPTDVSPTFIQLHSL